MAVVEPLLPSEPAPAVSTTEATNAKMLNQAVGKLLEAAADGNTDLVAAIEAITEAVTAALVGTARTITAGAGLTGGGNLSADRTIDVGAGTGIVVNPNSVAVDKASDANVRAAASDKVLTSDLIESASALVTLTDAESVALDWDAGINFALEITDDRTLANPTNPQPGTWRTIYLTCNSSKTLSFDSQYVGPAVESPPTPVLLNTEYLIHIYCRNTAVFVVTATEIHL